MSMFIGKLWEKYDLLMDFVVSFLLDHRNESCEAFVGKDV